MSRALLLAALLVIGAGASAAEPIETTLWRSVALGRLESLDPQQVVDYLHGSPDQAGYLLARCALAVAGEANPFPEWPLTRLLEERLDTLRPAGCGCGSRLGRPVSAADFDQAAQLYTLVMTGQASQAIERLGKRLQRDDTIGRDLAAQALAFIGSDEAKARLRRYAEATGSAVAANLLGARVFPPLHALAGYQRLIPAAERDRETLLALAGRGRGDREMLAVQLLGLLPAAADPAQQVRELELLRRGSRSDHFGYRYVSTRALGQRSAEDPGVWTAIYHDRPEDPWLRALVVRIAFTDLGAAFAPEALSLLAAEPSQYVQWRLLHGLLAAWSDRCLFTPFDLWLTPDLQLLIDCRHPDRGRLPAKAVTRVLDWLDAGHRPTDQAVTQELIYRLVGSVQGDDTRRLLRHWWGLLGDRPPAWWMLSALGDAGALPLLRFWLAESNDADARAILGDLISRLERAGRRRSRPHPCCDPQPHCLREHLETVAAPPVIATAEAAEAWLQAPARRPDQAIRFLDPLQRSAEVVVDANRVERWEHLYGCWVRVE